MKALIMDGSTGNNSPLSTINRKVALKLEGSGFNVETIHLNQEKIATCLGCFGCWLKTPGECIINDKGQEIARKVIQSDLLVLVTPITFGGYSYQLKKMVDRLIPNILPFFTKVNGEIHHQPRYEKYPDIFAIGYLPKPDATSERIFSKLIERNAINFHCTHYSLKIITGEVDYPDFDLNFDITLNITDKISNVPGDGEVVV